MKPFQPRTVHRYFELADSFVEVRELGGDGLELNSPKSLDRSTYRQLVLSTCLPEFDTDPGDRISTLFPEDPLLAEDCDDTDPMSSPGAPELCSDGKDNNCDGIETECEVVDTVTGQGAYDRTGASVSIGGDVDGDGEVGGADLAAILGWWGSDDESADLNGDGEVNGADLSFVLGYWGLCP